MTDEVKIGNAVVRVLDTSAPDALTVLRESGYNRTRAIIVGVEVVSDHRIEVVFGKIGVWGIPKKRLERLFFNVDEDLEILLREKRIFITNGRVYRKRGGK